ncbi:hypothetical protein K3495_g967 [Podosphaera aphanis]|nr:hypothetical protein K3495_g967 [Podosphaera aphanis]
MKGFKDYIFPRCAYDKLRHENNGLPPSKNLDDSRAINDVVKNLEDFLTPGTKWEERKGNTFLQINKFALFPGFDSRNHDIMSSPMEPEKVYQPQGEIFFDDGREEELVRFVQAFPNLERTPAGVLAAIDTFARTQKYLMNVGASKGNIIRTLVEERQPEIMLELGGYCGYSTILFADAQRRGHGKKYYSLERSPKFARNIEALVELAGLGDFVEVVVGPSDQGIQTLHDQGKVTKADIIFLDHYKPAYITDLKLCESLGLVQEGTMLIADNMIVPGNPPYLEYVQSSIEEKLAALEKDRLAALEKGCDAVDFARFKKSAATQYGTTEILNGTIQGNPRLDYRTELIDGWEPSGVPDAVAVSRCHGLR